MSDEEMNTSYEPRGNYFVFHGTRFIHVTEGHAKNWICYQHPDGQWVTLYHIPHDEDLDSLDALNEKAECRQILEQAFSALDSIMGDTDLAEDDSKEMLACQAIRNYLDRELPNPPTNGKDER